MVNILKLLQRKKELPANLFYSSADLCPLLRFKQAINSGSLQSLVISGSPPQSSLEDAWETIYSEFSEIIKDKTADLAFLHMKQTTAKRHKIAFNSVLLSVYATNPTDSFREMLTDEGFKVAQDAETTFRMGVGKLKRMQNDIEFSEKFEDKGEKSDFEQVISELERWQGYGFDQEKMSVRHFANIYKRFKDNGRKN